MESRPIPQPADFQYNLIFNPNESEVMAAAYREHIYEQVVRGKSSLITAFQTYVASWEDDTSYAIRTTNGSNVIDILGAFSKRTSDAIAKIPEQSGLPAFRSKDIALRHRLGEAAAKLAGNIAEEVGAPAFLKALDELPETPNRD